MSDKIEDIVDNINNVGNDLIDKVILPLVKTTKNIILDETKINYFLAFKTECIEQKIFLFIEYLKEKDSQEIIDFITELKDENKQFFVRTINKIFELDNSLQIYLLAYLTREYQKNGSLNYFEKTIYYNLEQLSEDDFKIFSELMFKVKPSEYNDKAYPIQDITEVEEIVLVKFINIGIIKQGSGTLGGPYFMKTEYADKLASVIKDHNRSSK